MTRSAWKTPFIDSSFLRRLKSKKIKKRTWSRRSTLYPVTVGLSLLIYNGKEMILRKISKKMVGHKVGEFVATRKPYVPKKKKKKKRKKK